MIVFYSFFWKFLPKFLTNYGNSYLLPKLLGNYRKYSFTDAAFGSAKYLHFGITISIYC